MNSEDIKDDIWKGLKSPTTWALAIGKVGILVTREATRFRAGEIDAEEFRTRTSGHVGSSAGLILGAATGAALGILLPVVGNVAGAFCGGVVGSMAGEEFGRLAVLVMEKTGIAPESTPPK